MLNYIEYLNLPAKVAFGIIVVFFAIQIIGELLEFKGIIVPEYIKVRKYIKRKKLEWKAKKQMPKTLEKVESLLSEVNEHYSEDNITKRNKWMNWVNDRAKVYDAGLVDLEKKIDHNNEITLSLLIDNKRDIIINFASKVIDDNYPVTREQFNRVIKIYKEYEKIIEEHNFENGEVDIAIRIIEESYEKHMKNHSFIEDVRGYNLP